MRSKLLGGIFSLLVLALMFSQPAQAGALSVEPLFVEIFPGQSGAVRVTNTADAPMSVELSLAERAVDETGKQTRTEREDDFLILPPLGVIPPREVRVFRFQAIAADIKQSHSYFLTVRQIPVSLQAREGGGAQIQVVFAFDVAVHAVPRGGKSNTMLVDAKLGQGSFAKPGTTSTPSGARNPNPEMETLPSVDIKLRNDGNKYAYLQDMGISSVRQSENTKPKIGEE